MSEYTCILNPVAGRGAARKVLAPLQKLLQEQNVSHELILTSRAGEATEIARQAPGPFVVAVGGDGTVNEVANGLIGTEKCLGVIPAGSGNDFIKTIGIGSGLEHTFGKLLARRTKRIDVGTVECLGDDMQHDSPGPAKRYFVNGVGVGFDAAVAARTREIKYLRGTLLYVAAVLDMLGKFKAPTFQVTTDSGQTTSKNLLIAVGNGTCAGGGFYLTPEAKIDDGLFDVCLIDDIGIGTILMLMPRVMVGKHVHAKQVKFLRTKKLNLLADRGFYVHADGEIVGRNATTVRIDMLESALSVLVGT